MEPKQICLYVHTAHGLPSAVCQDVTQRFWHFSSDSHPHVPLGLVRSLSLGLLGLSRCDILHVPAVDE